MYFKMLINWASQKVKKAYATRNVFDFKHGMVIICTNKNQCICLKMDIL